MNKKTEMEQEYELNYIDMMLNDDIINEDEAHLLREMTEDDTDINFYC